VLSPTRLKAVTGLSEAVSLFRELGFGGQAVPVDAGELGLGDHSDNLVLKSERGRGRGSALFIAESTSRPRSLKSFGKRLIQNFHDQPLGVLGVKSDDGLWERFIVVRPTWVRGVLNAVRVAKLEVDVSSPTRHDADVLTSLAWSGSDRDAQERVDRALDVEAVTKRFYLGLADHHERLLQAVREASQANPAVLNGIKQADGPERVALRILTQMLFCWFLQRMGLLAGDRDFLRNRFIRKRGPYYEAELEPLFYEALARPLGERPPDAPGEEIPFLNGGLFERHYGDVSLPLPDDLFDPEEGLIAFLGGWTFTVSEDIPDEVEVAVDPEMLGKVFENLIGDEEARRQGTVYTPRPVVHFMCREALVPWLQNRLDVSEDLARRLLVEDEAIQSVSETEGTEAGLALAERLDHALADVRVIDPAVGSGAFLLGMLAEFVRLRRLARIAVRGSEPSPHEIIDWKLHAIERSLFGVDINATAIELCRLRLWLSLVVELPPGETPHPLPNLEHRTIVANSLTDFVNGLEMQNTREHQAGLGLEVADLPVDAVQGFRHAYFAATEPAEKAFLRGQLAEHEDKLIEGLLDQARQHGERSPETLGQLDELGQRFLSFDREFPVFFPGFHAPDVWLEEGWDIAIMNPPYLGKKEVAQHLDRMRLSDYERHFGETNDLMILFARRARQLTKPGGVVSMIFNDSIFTSMDAEDLRREMFGGSQVLVCARTKCFEGKAINGGVIVQQLVAHDPPLPLRWVEGYKRPTTDFASASDPLPFRSEPGKAASAGQMEVFSAPADLYRLLPHRPLFRPSKEAIGLLHHFGAVERWDTLGTAEGWGRLSNTWALDREIEDLERTGWYDRLSSGQWVLLGYVIEGGQGLVTADDKHFLGAVQGTEVAEDYFRNQERMEALLGRDATLLSSFDKLRREGHSREEALLALWDDMANDSVLSRLWPKGATFRVAVQADVRTKPLSDEERLEGITSGPHWVPFEKGDQSQEVVGDDGRASFMGARWTRQNPVVIDWSRDSVSLLRDRARGSSSRRKPRLQNEHLWFTEGGAWNRVASYLRVRKVPSTAIFSSEAPTIAPRVRWMTPHALMALLNSPTMDFLLRTFLGSRMHIEIGDVRRIPIPVLSADQGEHLSKLAEVAIEEKQRADRGESHKLGEVEEEIDGFVRDLYGVPKDARFWVVR
jgi:hypothetical protein